LGERKKLKNFLLEVDIYLKMNQFTYNTDNKKIMFALSLMKEGVAGLWKKSFWTQRENDATLGLWDDFKTNLQKSFASADKEGDAITKMQTTQIHGKTANEFIEEFKNWQLQSGVKEDRPLIEWFMAALPSSLHDEILQLETPPTTIDKWYKVASRLYNN
jgi:hypothetical protein